jgi:hypothetical protein
LKSRRTIVINTLRDFVQIPVTGQITRDILSLYLSKQSVVNITLLDGVGAGFILVLFGLGLLFILLAVFIEGVVMMKMKYHNVFKRALLHSLVANLVSLALGFILINSDREFYNIEYFSGFVSLFAITLVSEFMVLYLMNRKESLLRTLTVCVVMNLVTYLLAFLLLRFVDF